MQVVLSLMMIVAIEPGAPIPDRPIGAIEVFHCDFGLPWDQNYDSLPDRWVRRRGQGFPHYVRIEIEHDQAAIAGNSLRIKLDGGAGALYSPPIAAAPWQDYVLDALVATEGLEHDSAFLSLTFLNPNRKKLKTRFSKKIGGSQEVTLVRLGPIVSDHPDTRFAVIGLHLEPEANRADLTGSARFEDVWLGRLPRMSLSMDRTDHVFFDSEPVHITCRASGFTREDTAVRTRLTDVTGQVIAESIHRLNTKRLSGNRFVSKKTDNPPPSKAPEGATPPSNGGLGHPKEEGNRPKEAADTPPREQDDTPQVSDTFTGVAKWVIPPMGTGFYHVEAEIVGGNDLVLDDTITLAVIRAVAAPSDGVFGWSLPQGKGPLPLEELSRLATQVGIRWIKYPLWYSQASSEKEIHAALQFVNHLASRGISTIGLLNDPPEGIRGPNEKLATAAEIFLTDPGSWYPSAESPAMQIAAKVRTWQLGADLDTGFIGYGKLSETLARIRSHIVGQTGDVRLGFAWQWNKPYPEVSESTPAWQFLAMSGDPPLTPEELTDRLAAPRNRMVDRWVVLRPLSKTEHPLAVRAGDLARKMLAAKIGQAEAVFHPDPFHAEYGLMNENGSAGDLLLPWRTCAMMLAGSVHLGQIEMPGGTPNHVFARSGGAVMVVWNDAPGEEVLYLGKEVQQVDLWGRPMPVENRDGRQAIQIGTLPTFVTGVDAEVARWRKSFTLASKQLPGVGGRPHKCGWKAKNPGSSPRSGHVELVGPEAWQWNPPRRELLLGPGEVANVAVEVTFPYNVTTGPHPLRADFQIGGARPQQFSVYRWLHVGPTDVRIEVGARLNDQGELEVEQRLISGVEEPLSFRCQLFIPDRRRRTSRILDQGPGTQVTTYRLPDGQSLLGKVLWLQVDQIDGPRVLNYRFVAKQ